jgi:hypothetical protein
MLTSVVTVTQNSARVQQSTSPITCDAGHDAFPSSRLASGPRRPASSFRILIASTRLEFELSGKASSQLQISNRERMAIFVPAEPSELQPSPKGLLIFLNLQPLTLNLQILIVTPRLEFAATRRKQSPNPISNRYKSCILHPGVGPEIQFSICFPTHSLLPFQASGVELPAHRTEL